jgi:hypothetical protein
MTDTAAILQTGHEEARLDERRASTPAVAPRPTNVPANVPPRPARDTRLDLLRGWLQLTIFASHATGTWIGVWLIYAPWGLSDSSEQFVFLSGFTLGSVFARKAARDGWRAGAADLLRRTWRLYRTHLVVFVLYGAMVCAAGVALLPGEAARMGWSPLLADPLRHLPRALLALEQPNYMGILPLFAWCMLLLPGFAAAEARWGDRALVLPLVLYGGAWLLNAIVPELGLEDGIGFNPFAWQLLFLGGAWLGRRALLYGRALPFGAAGAGWVSVAAAGVLAAGLLVQLGWHGFVPWLTVPHADWLTDKKDLAPARLLHALALAWLIAAHMPREAEWLQRAVPRWIEAIGRHSLHVFCVGLFLSWGASAVFRLTPATPLRDPALILVGCGVLAVFAWWREQRLAAARLAAA